MEKQEARKYARICASELMNEYPDLFPDSIGFATPQSTDWFGRFEVIENKVTGARDYTLYINGHVLEAAEHAALDDAKKLIKSIVGHEMAHYALVDEVPQGEHHGHPKFKKMATNLGGSPDSSLTSDRSIRSLESFRKASQNIAMDTKFHGVCRSCEENDRKHMSGMTSQEIGICFGNYHVNCGICGDPLLLKEKFSKLKPWTWSGENKLYDPENKEGFTVNAFIFALCHIIMLAQVWYNEKAFKKKHFD